MLTLNNISKTYRGASGEIDVLKEFSVSIPKNQFVAFVGPSGCGKTTLLRILSGLTQPTEGKIVLGKNKNNITHQLSMVFQEFSLFPWLTVRKNIGFGENIQKLPSRERDKKIDYYLNMTGLKKFEHDYPKTLSGGMKQRVAIARAMINDTEILLMDEPFGSLDPQTRYKMQDFLTQIWDREQRTILFVTHEIEEALYLADVIHVLGSTPTSIKKSFTVPFPRPRKQSLKQTKEFFDLRNTIIKEMAETHQ